MSETTTTLTPNQKIIRVQFNTNQDPNVAELKDRYTELLNTIDRIKEKMLSDSTKSTEWKARTGREFSMARTELESSAHWAVKGATAHFQD